MPISRVVAKDLLARILVWRENPIQFVTEVFRAEPDEWQMDALRVLGRPGRVRLALKACAGPGKTAVLAWEGWRRLLCYGTQDEHPKGLAVSCSADNLSDNLWAELARWRNVSPLIQSQFEWTKEKIFNKDNPETWFLAARTYRQTADEEAIGRTLSGHHSRFVFYLIDESGDMSPSIIKSAEQGLTGCEHGLELTAGNTTSQTGLLYHVCSALGDRWDVISITGDPDDPKRSPRVDKDWAREQIAEYGRDNAWVMAYVLGQFPPGGINQLISLEEVEAAMRRAPRSDTFSWSEKRIGVDVARFGDDRTVIFPRQGIAAFNPIIMRVADTSQIAARVAEAHNVWGKDDRVDGIYIDDSGHWGHGVLDQLRTAQFPALGIIAEAPSPEPQYYNMRAMEWALMTNWVKEGGALPNVPGLAGEMAAPTYSFYKGKFLLEDKKQVKKRLKGKSPDLADALALTFAFPDRPKVTILPGIGGRPGMCQTKYDVWAELDKQ